MERKTKNIIAIIVITILLVGLILTVYFAKNNNSYGKIHTFPNVIKDNNQRYSRENFKKERSNNKSSFNEKSEEFELEEDTGKLETSDSIIEADIHGNNSYGIFHNINEIPNNNAIDCIYVVLLCIETFLIGGTTMYLIMININTDRKEIIEEKTKKANKK